ncbi:SAV_2336 N-terminal domain-related protein [Streptomyces sp. CA-111067]|uniref:SAV_2336 N-terminal domain-related protein n=1 Tax=Streptomyces sp. CA-111067 TaxID=3240046 RepID=UPI003D9928A5
MRDLADAIWLARQFGRTGSPQSPPVQARSQQAEPASVEKGPATPRDLPTPAPAPSPTPTTTGTILRAPTPRSSVSGEPTTAVRLVDRPDLRRRSELCRALKPLGVPFAAPGGSDLDEEATAEASADAETLVPVLRENREKWLDLSLVVDESTSMAVWRRTARELYELLAHLGVFRNVRAWRLDGDVGPVLSPYRAEGPLPTAPGGAHGPEALHDSTSRRLIIVLTDCVGRAWGSPRMAAALKGWQQHGHLLLVNTLPHRMRHRTLLRPEPVRWRYIPGIGPRLMARSPGRSRSAVGADTLRGAVPVVGLTPEELGVWAAGFAGVRQDWFHGRAVDVRAPAEPDPEAADEALGHAVNAERPPPREIIDRFRADASDTAFRLAGLLAAAPLTMPVMRLIQQTLLPPSDPGHLAEVFLSGLIGRIDLEGSVHPDHHLYDFVTPGLREELLTTLNRTEAFNVLDLLGALPVQLAERFGGTLDFRALVPEWGGPELLPQESLPFANVAITVLSGLGPAHAQIARRIEAAADPALAQALYPLPSDRTPVLALELIRSDDDLCAVVAREAGTLELWYVDERGLRRGWSVSCQRPVTSLAVARTGQGATALTCHSDGSVQTWLLGETVPTSHKLPLDLPVTLVSCRADSATMALVGRDRTVRLWDLDQSRYDPFHGTAARPLAAVAAHRTVSRWTVTGTDAWGDPVPIHDGLGFSSPQWADRLGRRRFLSLAVSAYSAQWDVEDDPFWLEDLPFVPEAAHDLAAEFERLGYESEVTVDPTTQEMERQFHSLVSTSGPSDVLVVHIVGHGVMTQNQLRIPGGDAGADPSFGIDVQQWQDYLQDRADSPFCLFLIDTAHAGAAIALSPVHRKGPWVIAACDRDEMTHSAVFTRAATATMRHLEWTDTAASQAYVGLGPAFNAVRAEVSRLCEGTLSFTPQATATAPDGNIEVPFFPNPLYRHTTSLSFAGSHDELYRLRDATDFVGRHAELQRLGEWLGRDADTGPPMFVVTGAPGVGKSALLGQLIRRGERAVTVALNLRGWDAGMLVEALVERLSLPLPPTGQTIRQAVAELAKALAEGAQRPTVVLDSLDEARDPEEIVHTVLLPLLTAHTPPVRFLSGTRSLPELLSPFTRVDHAIMDLKPLPASDLHTYIESMVASVPAYDRAELVAARHAFAERLASALAQAGTPSAPLIARHFVDRTRRETTSFPADVAEARRLGSQVPGTMGEMMDLDLAHMPTPLLRTLLTVLAHAKGQGMPLTVITRILGQFETHRASAPSVEDTRSALGAGAPYLTTVTETDGTALHRLIHASLVDHLRSSRDTVVDLKAVSAGVAGHLSADPGRGWEFAEPYVLRHALAHALDAGDADFLLEDADFLVHADRADGRYLSPVAKSARARRMAAIYDTAMGSAAPDVDSWRRALAGTARRLGHPELAEKAGARTAQRTVRQAVLATVVAGERTVMVSGEPSGRLHVWDPSDGTSLWVATAHAGGVTSVGVLGEVRPVVVSTGVDGSLRAWDLASSRLLWKVETAAGGMASVGVLRGGRSVVVSAGADGALRVWDASDGSALTMDRPLPVVGVHGAYNYRVGMTSEEAAEITSREWMARLRQSLGPLSDRVALNVAYWAPYLRSDRTQDITGVQDLSTPAAAAAGDVLADLSVPTQPARRVSTSALRGLVTRLSQSYSQLTATVAIRMIQEIGTYLSEPSGPQRIAAREAVAEAIERARPRVVLAHSLGGVIAYEALWAHSELRVELLVTMGTPLGLSTSVAQRLQPEPVSGRGRRPPQVDRWIDLSSRNDLMVGAPLSSLFDGVEVYRIDGAALDSHALSSYLTHPQLASVLAGYLG